MNAASNIVLTMIFTLSSESYYFYIRSESLRSQYRIRSDLSWRFIKGNMIQRNADRNIYSLEFIGILFVLDRILFE